ncbi:unnamed protein product [Pelagomonas calceolata]|uniref:Uncharacterized protein n=1 Tax=Pelagomonas calceolata TaxID=35677 RepID=A0A8J2S8E2_9STRA|nr:unnamed protein product [Pelagomonas calceolata]
MATFATLPGDLLTAIASYVDGPQIVVAVAADGDARAALRRGVDAAEEALRGVTIREAEFLLLHSYHVQAAALSDRQAAGLVLVENAAGYYFDSDIIPTLLAYRAVPDVETSSTIDGEVRVAGRALHYVSGSGHERSLLFAAMLLDAGADVNARCDPENLAGTTALAWALAADYELDENDEPTIYCEDLDSVLTKLHVARKLIRRGADIGIDSEHSRAALSSTEDYVACVFDLSIQRWGEVDDDVRRALLATMPDCTEELSEIYYFIADRLDASLAAAHAAKMASLENSIREDENKIEEARRKIRGYQLQIRHKTLEIAVNKAAIIALTPLMVIIAAGTVARRVGWDRWVDLENEWFSFGRCWFCFVFFCLVVAHAIVRGIVLRERKKA